MKQRTKRDVLKVQNEFLGRPMVSKACFFPMGYLFRQRFMGTVLVFCFIYKTS